MKAITISDKGSKPVNLFRSIAGKGDFSGIDPEWLKRARKVIG